MEDNLLRLKNAVHRIRVESRQMTQILKSSSSQPSARNFAQGRRRVLESNMLVFAPLLDIALKCQQPSHQSATLQSKQRLHAAYARAYQRLLRSIQLMAISPELLEIPIPGLIISDTANVSLTLSGQTPKQILGNVNRIQRNAEAEKHKDAVMRKEALQQLNDSLTEHQRELVRKISFRPSPQGITSLT